MAEAPQGLSLRLVAAMALASALAPLNSTMLSVALRPIGAAFGASDSTLTRALVTSYLVTSIVMQAPGGKLGDLLGHRRALAFGQMAFALGAVLALFSPTLTWLVVARVAMAAAGAMIVPSAMALLRTELPLALRGRAFGIFGASMALSAALGPPVGGQITVWFGFRAVFVVNLVVLPISAWLARTSSKSAAAPAKVTARYDYLGTLLLGSGLACLALGVGRGGAIDLRLALACPVLLAIFVWVEGRAASPIVDLGLLRVLPFVTSGLLIALHNLAMYALLFELPNVCGMVLGSGASGAGRLLVSLMAPMVVFSPIAGRLTDSHGARRVALVGTTVALVGMVVLLLTPLRSLLSPVPGLVILGAGLGLSSSPAQSAGMSAIPASKSGVAAGMMATLRYLGGVIGTLILGVLFGVSRVSSAIGAADDASAAVSLHRRALTIFCVALALAVACAVGLPSLRRAES